MISLHRISPFGPIFGKEIRAMSRRRRNYLLRVLYLGGLLLLLTMAYTSMSYMGANSVAARIQRQAMIGQSFFQMFSFFCLVTMTLIGPILTCTAIGGEKLHRTLHVLLMTPLNTWQILGGKLFSRLLQALVLLGLSLPVLAVVRLLGGTELWQMGMSLAICLVTAIYAASVGLMLSTMMTRAYAVILLSYGILALQYLFFPMIVALLSLNQNPRAFEWSLMAAASPFFAMGFVVMGGVGAAFQVSGAGVIVVHIFGTILMLLLSAAILRRYQKREHSGASCIPLVSEPQPLAPAEFDPTTGSLPPPLLPDSVAPTASRTVSDNPVRWREMRRPLFARRWQAIAGWIVIAGLMLFVYGLLAVNNDLDDDGTHIAFGVILSILWWMLATVLSATVIAQEKEGDTWTLMLATPVSGATIVLGKFLGVLKRMWMPTVLLAAHFAVFSIVGYVTWTASIVVMWCTISCFCIWMASGIYLSLRVSRVTVAVILNIALALIVYVFAPMFEAMLASVINYGRGWDGPFTFHAQPLMYVVMAVDRLDPGFDWSRTVRLPQVESLTVPMFLAWAFVVGVIHLLLTAGILAWTIARFDRIVGRAQQLHRP